MLLSREIIVLLTVIRKIQKQILSPTILFFVAVRQYTLEMWKLISIMSIDSS